MNRDQYLALVEERKFNHQPIPPAQYFKHAGHHWLAYRPPASGLGGTAEIMVAQWSPTQHVWYHSNELATNALPIAIDGLMTHWEWVAHVPVPELDEKIEIPEDMTPWHGGEGPPEDWNREKVLHRNGRMGSLNTESPSYWRYDDEPDELDIIAYTAIRKGSPLAQRHRS
jgi:hypothetical protein